MELVTQRRTEQSEAKIEASMGALTLDKEVRREEEGAVGWVQIYFLDRVRLHFPILSGSVIIGIPFLPFFLFFLQIFKFTKNKRDIYIYIHTNILSCTIMFWQCMQ